MWHPQPAPSVASAAPGLWRDGHPPLPPASTAPTASATLPVAGSSDSFASAPPHLLSRPPALHHNPSVRHPVFFTDHLHRPPATLPPTPSVLLPPPPPTHSNPVAQGYVYRVTSTWLQRPLSGGAKL